MTQEVLIPKMKRLDKKHRKVKVPLLNFVLIIFCTLLLIGATFLNIDFKHYIIPTDIFSNKSLTPEDYIRQFSIIPQIPTVMLICSILGKKMSATSIILYLLAGLFIIPVFALGGGIGYITEYSFGYILAYFPAVILAGSLLKKYTFFDLTKATLCGVLIIHFCGIIYMSIIALLKHNGTDFISSWISAQSGLKIIYDLVISFIFMLIGKYIHEFLKMIQD